MYHNGTQVLTCTDYSGPTGGSPGLGLSSSGGAGLTLDNWEGGNLSITRLVITGSGTQTAGGTQDLTITAEDASGNTVTTYTGPKTLIFSGANSSANPVTAPSVKFNSGSSIAFGSPTTINFNNGVAQASDGNIVAMTLYKAETATISVSDGSSSSSGSDRLTVTVSALSMNKFALSLTSPQNNGVAFSGVNTLTAQDAYGNTVGFDASANNVTIMANSPLTGSVSGLSGGNTLTGAGDFISGVANLTALGMKYTGNAGTGIFTASAASGGYTGSSGSVTINAALVAQVVASDNFDRENASDLGTNWTRLSGTSPYPFLGNLVITNNQACANAPSVDCFSYWSGGTNTVFSADQYLAGCYTNSRLLYCRDRAGRFYAKSILFCIRSWSDYLWHCLLLERELSFPARLNQYGCDLAGWRHAKVRGYWFGQSNPYDVPQWEPSADGEH